MAHTVKLGFRVNFPLKYKRVKLFLSVSLLLNVVSPPSSAANACVQGVDFKYLSEVNANPVIISFTNTSECDFNLPSSNMTFSRVLVVGAGGGGGGDGGSGGGGGESRYLDDYQPNVATIRVKVGAGGLGGSWGGGSKFPQRDATNGGDSYIRTTTNTDLFLAKGGGAGNGWGFGNAASGGIGGGISGRTGGTGPEGSKSSNGQTGGAGPAGCSSSAVTFGSSPSGSPYSDNITGSNTNYGGGGGGGSAFNGGSSVTTESKGKPGGGTSGGMGAGYRKTRDNTVFDKGSTSGYAGTLNTGGGGGAGSACDSFGPMTTGSAHTTLNEAYTIDGIEYAIGTRIDGSLQRTNGGDGADGVIILKFEKLTPTFSLWSNVSKTYGDSSYTVTAPTVTGSLAGSFSYASSNTSVISISGSTFTVVGAGTATITATFTPTDSTNYNNASTTNTVTVAKATQSDLSITSISGTYGSTLTLTSSGGSSAGAVTYVVNSGSCSVLGSTLSNTAVGDCYVTATMAGGDNYNDVSSSSTNVVIGTRPITITAGAKTATYTGSSVSVSNSYSVSSGSLAGLDAISSLTYTYTSAGGYDSTTAPTNAGTYTITPSAANFSTGSASNYTIIYGTATLTISQATPTFSSWSNVSKTYGDSSYTVTAPTVTGSLAGSFSYASSNARSESVV